MAEKDFILEYTQVPSEFKEDPSYYVLFAANGLQMGKMIAASKSTYCHQHQRELMIFNANIITKK